MRKQQHQSNLAPVSLVDLSDSQDIWVPVLDYGPSIKVTASTLTHNLTLYADIKNSTTAMRFLECYLKRYKSKSLSRETFRKITESPENGPKVLAGVVCTVLAGGTDVLPVYLQDPSLKESKCIPLQLPVRFDLDTFTFVGGQTPIG